MKVGEERRVKLEGQKSKKEGREKEKVKMEKGQTRKWNK